MKIALVGAELEENLGLRYICSMLESKGHLVKIIPFNSDYDIPDVVDQVVAFTPVITGLSMVFTSRAHEFCSLAKSLRDKGYSGHLIAGGHFAAFNSEYLLKDFTSFDSVALGEGEIIVSDLADQIEHLVNVPGLCYRMPDGSIKVNPSNGNPRNLDLLPFPKRTKFHNYFDKPIASILSSRGCWRNCAFCSINAWYEKSGGKKFRIRSVENIVAEMKELYHLYGIRIFNFQDDNFFLPDKEKALKRFEAIRSELKREGIEDIAIAIKARPDSITYDSISVLKDLGLFRVFLGVENASQHGLQNLNRKCSFDLILNSLQILNDFDVHIAYNLLLFEPDTTLDDILINLNFMERHLDNPFNFCRAEAYAGTGLEFKLRTEGKLLGDYFGFDYRLNDRYSESFHLIANYAFFNRNFSDSGLHYFNMQVDFYYHLLKRFYPELLTQTHRSSVKQFIKQTNLDTYQFLCQIYDFVSSVDTNDQVLIRGFAREMRELVDEKSREMLVQGKCILNSLEKTYKQYKLGRIVPEHWLRNTELSFVGCKVVPYTGLNSLEELEFIAPENGVRDGEPGFCTMSNLIPYKIFKDRLNELKENDKVTSPDNIPEIIDFRSEKGD